MAADEVATEHLNFQPPSGLCDTHMHIYEAGYPTVAGATTPVRGTLENYRALRKTLGIERTIIVQPAAYGFDNRCTIASMAKQDGSTGCRTFRRETLARYAMFPILEQRRFCVV